MAPTPKPPGQRRNRSANRGQWKQLPPAKGVQAPARQARLGEVDLAMTMRYVHHVPAHDAAARLSAVVAAADEPFGARSVPRAIGIEAARE